MSGKLSAQKATALLTRPQNGVEPLFAAPWEAQAFATAVHLQACGVFSGQEWADCLAAEISLARQQGGSDPGDTYYRHWLAALEHLVILKGLTTESALRERSAAWERAARATPHGQPIVLRDD